MRESTPENMPNASDDSELESRQAKAERSHEALPSAERLRRAQAEHDYRLALTVSERLRLELDRRAGEGDASAEEARQNLDILEKAEIVERTAVKDATSVGVTERCSVGEGDDERIAFLKWQAGELAVAGGGGEPKKLQRTLRDDGTLEAKEVPIHGKRADSFARLVAFRAVQQEDFIEKMGTNYGIPADRVPLRTDVIGLKRIDVGHSTRAEVAASVLSMTVGFPEVPVTAMRFDRHELGSMQLRATGGSLGVTELMDIYERGADHPAAPSIARLAALDFLLKSSDRHINNFFIDIEKNQCYGIDNSYSNGYSVPNTEAEQGMTGALRSIPADKYRSVAMEIVDDVPGMELAQADREQLRQLVDDVTSFMKWKEGKLAKAEAEALPEHVLKGEMARLLSDTYRMLHERVDEEGKPIPETTAIAKRELHDMLTRADYLATHGRPPHMTDWQHDRDSLKRIVESHKKAAAQKLAAA